MIDIICDFWYYSNTTLVKVKLQYIADGDGRYDNSNTTLVKVKYPAKVSSILNLPHSNTTLVKVK